MLYFGLDIHTKHISICAPSEAGQVTHRSRVRRQRLPHGCPTGAGKGMIRRNVKLIAVDQHYMSGFVCPLAKTLNKSLSNS
jgi:hypothetical protein